MIRGGIYLQSFASNQLSIMLTNSLNTLCHNRADLSIICFMEDWGPLLLNTNFPVMQSAEIWNYNAPVISTDLFTTKVLLQCPCPKKYFYIWDLEWLFSKTHISFDEINSIYTAENIKLIARSQYHFDIITKCWKEPIVVMSDFSAITLTEILEGKHG